MYNFFSDCQSMQRYKTLGYIERCYGTCTMKDITIRYCTGRYSTVTMLRLGSKLGDWVNTNHFMSTNQCEQY